MVFDRFIASFRVLPEGQVPGVPWLDDRLVSAAGYRELVERFAGVTFENGLYRLHDDATGPHGAALLADVFPAFAARACPFGYDWLGRQFAVDSQRRENGEALVLMMEPGTGQALEIPLPLAGFHEQLDELREPALAATFFAEWTLANPASLPVKGDECVGYRVPLFLGGKDDLDNLEVTDLDVYWSLSGQLHHGTGALPDGTAIRDISISE